MADYEHTQQALWIRVLLGSLGLFGAAAALALSERQAGVWVPTLVAALIVGFCAWHFGSLTVRVEQGRVRVLFGPGWIRRTFALEHIQSVEPVQNKWWYGFGIHLTPHGWLFNVSGMGAVELQLREERRVRIGTDEPERLAAAIERALGPPRPSAEP